MAEYPRPGRPVPPLRPNGHHQPSTPAALPEPASTRRGEAAAGYARAAALAPTDAERDFLSRGGRGSR